MVIFDETVGLVTARENRTFKFILKEVIMPTKSRPTSLSHSIIVWEIFIFCKSNITCNVIYKIIEVLGELKK